MKKLSFLSIALCFAQVTFAQSPVDSKGRRITTPTPVTKLNTVSTKSVAQETANSKAVFLESGGVLVDANGKILGRMSKNKNIYPNASGQVILPEDARCNIVDSKGRTVVHEHCKAKEAFCEVHGSKKETSQEAKGGTN